MNRANKYFLIDYMHEHIYYMILEVNMETQQISTENIQVLFISEFSNEPCSYFTSGDQYSSVEDMMEHCIESSIDLDDLKSTLLLIYLGCEGLKYPTFMSSEQKFLDDVMTGDMVTCKIEAK